jgi:protein transport protein SEC20
VNASNDVTIALRRLHEGMAGEVSKSHYANEMLHESTLKVKQLDETYSSLDTLLNSSKNLLGTLLRSQKSDTWYLETAFYILCATIAWLFWRRILYGPTWWLVWSCRWFLLFPLQMFIKGWIGVFTAVGILGGSTSETSISPVVGEGTAVYSSGTILATPTAGVSTGGSIAPSQPGTNPQEFSDGSMSEQVGRIIDDAGNTQRAGVEDGNHTVEDGGPEDKPNPKKRMFEDTEAVKAQKKKDEL